MHYFMDVFDLESLVTTYNMPLKIQTNTENSENVRR
jgi:hypothetical protein